ncbi:MAG: hypothetical protein U0931_24235 [Vulcanimicrobiota bacterium]
MRLLNQPWQAQTVHHLLWTSLLVAAGAALTSLGFGVIQSILLCHHDLPLRRLWQACCLSPLLWPPYLLAVAWLSFFPEAKAGQFPCTPSGLAFLLGLWGTPLVTAAGLLGLGHTPRGLIEAAILKETPARLWIRIVAPLVAPFWLTGAVLVFTLSLQDQGLANLLLVNTRSTEVYADLEGYNQPAGALAAALPLVWTGALLVLLLGWLWRSHLRPWLRDSSGVQFQWRLRRGRLAGLALMLPLTGLSLLPLVWLLAGLKSFRVFQLAYWEAGGDILNSLVLGLASASLALFWGALLATGTRGSQWWLSLALVPLCLPPALLALGWVGLDWPGCLPLVVAQAQRLTGLVALWIGCAYATIPDSWRDLIRMRGNGSPHIFYHPFRQTLWQAWSLAFYFSLADLTINLLLSPPGVGTLSARIFNLQHYGRPDLVAALSLTLTGMALTPWLAAQGWRWLKS